MEQAFTRARELCEQLGDPPELFPALFGLFALFYLRGELSIACALAEQLMQRAHDAHDPTLLLMAHMALGDTSQSSGKPLIAIEHCESALSLYDPERHRQIFFGGDARINPLSYAGASLCYLGYPDQALKRSNEAVGLARSLSNPHDLAFAEAFGCLLCQLRRDAHATQDAAERLIALSAEHGFTFWLEQARIMRGAAIAEQGRNEEGIAQMQEGIAALRAAGPRPQFLRFLAKACIEKGCFDDALSALAEASAAVEFRDHEPELHRLKGELLLKQNNSSAAEAESCFRRAIEIARNQSAKSWELRATMSLARLLAKQRHRNEARAMLADIYNWFTEGFDTADLIDAKALLDELNS